MRVPFWWPMSEPPLPARHDVQYNTDADGYDAEMLLRAKLVNRAAIRVQSALGNMYQLLEVEK